MELLCGKCCNEINNKQQLTCSVCRTLYHLDCTDVSFGRFRIMTAENKANWKCYECVSKLQKKSTPCKASPLIKYFSSPHTENNDNVTLRNKKYRINVSTENSFQSLSDDSEELGGHTLNSTNILNRSCPDIGLMDCSKIEHMESEIDILRKKLEIADNEISNLLQENFALKNTILENETMIKKLTHFCKSSPKITSIKERRKSLEAKKIGFKQEIHRIGLDRTLPLIKEVKCNSPLSEKISRNKTRSTCTNRSKSEDVSPQFNLCYNENINTEKSINTGTIVYDKISKIHIFGGELVSGLTEKMLADRFGKWNNIYSIHGFVKPYATSSQILTSCYSSTSITENDIIVLSIGTNDKDPYKIMSELCNISSKFKNNKIFILSINTNPYLNVKKLNYELEMLIQNYSNCTFLNIDYPKINPIPNKIIKTISMKLNIVIDYQEYKNTYIKNVYIMHKINYKNGLESLTNHNIKNGVKINSSNKPIKNKRTIIDYFYPINNSKSVERKHTSLDDIEKFHLFRDLKQYE